MATAPPPSLASIGTTGTGAVNCHSASSLDTVQTSRTKSGYRIGFFDSTRRSPQKVATYKLLKQRVIKFVGCELKLLRYDFVVPGKWKKRPRSRAPEIIAVGVLLIIVVIVGLYIELS